MPLKLIAAAKDSWACFYTVLRHARDQTLILFVRHPCNLDITVSDIGLCSFSLQLPMAHGIIISKIYGISQIHTHPVEEVDIARENENHINFICPKDWMLIETTGHVNFKQLKSCFLETYPGEGGMDGHCDFNESQVFSF